MTLYQVRAQFQQQVNRRPIIKNVTADLTATGSTITYKLRLISGYGFTIAVRPIFPENRVGQYSIEEAVLIRKYIFHVFVYNFRKVLLEKK